MEIRTANCKLRSFKKDDVEAYYEVINDKAIEKYVPYAYCKNIIQAKRTVNDYISGDCVNDFYLVIEKENIIVGSIIAVRVGKDCLDLSVCLGKKFRNKGIMYEALKGFFDWLKENTVYENIHLSIHIDNEYSIRLFEKLDAKFIKHQNNYNTYYIYLRK